MRTCLVALRKNLGPDAALQTAEHEVSLNPSVFESDLDLAEALDRKVRLASDDSEELHELDRLANLIAPGILPSWIEDWLVGHQESWRLRKLEILQRSADLSLKLEQIERATELASEVLRELPEDTFAWTTYLIAMARQGEGREALRRFQSVRKGLAAEGLDEISDSVRQLAKAIRDGAYGPVPELPILPPGMERSIGRAFQRMMASNLQEAARFACSDSFRLEILRAPKPSVQLLESILNHGPLDGPEDVSLRIMTMRTHSILHNVERVLELGADLLEENLQPLQRRLVLTVMSHGHFLIRDFEAAFRLVDQAVEIADKHAPPHLVHYTHADRALYLWHTGREDEALDICVRAYEATKDEPEHLVSYAPAFLCGVIGSILLGLDQIVEADRWLRTGYAIARTRQYHEQTHQIEPPYGCSRARLGSKDESGKLAFSALAHFRRSGNQRAFAASMDYVASILCDQDMPAAATGCLDWGQEHRAKLRHNRTQFEQRFADALRSRTGGIAPDTTIRGVETHRQMLERLSEILDASG